MQADTIERRAVIVGEEAKLELREMPRLLGKALRMAGLEGMAEADGHHFGAPPVFSPGAGDIASAASPVFGVKERAMKLTGDIARRVAVFPLQAR